MNQFTFTMAHFFLKKKRPLLLAFILLISGAHVFSKTYEPPAGIPATPNSGYVYSGRSGGLSGSNSQAQITMDGNKTVTAAFAPQSAWTVIQYDNFEAGLGNYTAGRYGELYTGGDYAHEGNNAARIRDNQGAHSTITSLSGGFSVAGYSQVEIKFQVYAVNMDDPSVDRLEVFYRPGNGSYQRVGAFYYGADFQNGEFTQLSIILDASEYEFLDRTRLQFRSYAEEPDDSFYLDEITISGNGPVATEQFSLAVNTSGSGSVSMNPPGGVYDAGTVVTLTATPADGWLFGGWSGDLTGSNSRQQVTIDGHKNITATFAQQNGTPVNLAVVSVNAGAYEDPNVPENTLDNDFATRWSADGAQWIAYDLGAVHTLAYLDIAFHNGDQRTASFDIEVSTDGVHWTQVFSGSSGGATTAPETFEFNDTPGRYVRISGHGNSVNTWNSYTEVDIYGYGEVSPARFTLTATTAGGGSVSPDPSGGVYDPATVVTLTASPQPGWKFDGWSGDLTTTANPADITMDADKTVTAVFSQLSGGGGSDAPVAVSMKYHVVENKQKFVALAGYSNNITYKHARYGDSPIERGVRYKEAITGWTVQSLPVNGTLYDGQTEITSVPYAVSDPDELLYAPGKDFTGNDSFAYTVTDAIGSSGTATVSLIVESSVTLPAGIPAMPSIFNTEAPVPAASGDTETADWYIDNTHPDATDTPQGNERNPRHGTPDRPRLTIPPSGTTFAAGARIFIAGGVATPYQLRSGVSWHQWICPGTEGSPVYFIGVNNGPAKPVITSGRGRYDQLRLQAQYTIFEGINFKGIRPDQRDGQPGGHVVFRHIVLDGENMATNGSAISADVSTHNIFYDMHIKRTGFTEPDLSEENDVHGILISASNVWVMDNLIHGCAGDAMQLIGAAGQNRYVGRNKLHSDNENAIDLKGRYDLIFVENDVWDYRAIQYTPGKGSDGAAVIVNVDKYGTPTRATIARNRIWDANSAVRHQGNYIWTTDNVFWHIHHNENSTGRAYTVVVGNNDMTGYTDRITNNTFHKVDGGVWIWAGDNSGLDHQYKGNNFGELNESSLEGYHFSINSNHAEGTVIDYNNYSSTAMIKWADTDRDLAWMRANTASSANDTENRDPVFTDAGNFDLSLAAGSPLPGCNVEHVTYREFFAAYGTSIQFDINNVPRPQGGAWDIGAYAYAGGESKTAGPAESDNTLAVHPNPISAGTTIQYELSRAGYVELTLLDLRGQTVAKLFSGHLEAGGHTFRLNLNDTGARALPGVYLIRLSGNNVNETSMVIIK